MGEISLTFIATEFVKLLVKRQLGGGTFRMAVFTYFHFF